MCEPASAWMVRRRLARTVGAWSRPGEGGPTPLQDWLARAIRAAGVRSAGDRPTVLKVNLHHRGDGPRYLDEDPAHAGLARLLEVPPDVVRAWIRRDLEDAPATARTPRGERDPARVGRLDRGAAKLRFLAFRATGRTGLLSASPSVRRARNALPDAVGWRTGEPAFRPPPVATLGFREIAP